MKPLIALTGRAGSGKNTVATMLAESGVDFVREFSFAEPLKRFCQEVFAFTDAQVFGPSEERNRPDPRYPRGDVDCDRCDARGATYQGTCPKCDGDGAAVEYLTPRFALQTLGTNWGRACYENIWAEYGVRKARGWLADLDRTQGYATALAVITDCRFVNEAQAVRDAGGEVWRIVRPGSGLAGSAGLHPSETEQESPAFLKLVTRTIHNVGTLEELRAQVAG